MERTPEIQKLLNELSKAMSYENSHILDIGGSHPDSCRCVICLRFWVLIGAEEVAEGVYHFGPFTQEEYLAAGGVIPEPIDDWEEEEEWDIQP